MAKVNFLEETLDVLENYMEIDSKNANKRIDYVLMPNDEMISWNDFAKVIKDVVYDNTSGQQIIPEEIRIVFKKENGNNLRRYFNGQIEGWILDVIYPGEAMRSKNLPDENIENLKSWFDFE